MTDSGSIGTARGPVSAAGAVPRLKTRNHWLVPVIAGMILLGGATIWWWLKPNAAVRYVTQPLTRGAIVRAITASGTVNPVIVVQVGTYVSGVVQERFCDYNTEVKKGQLCATIDPRLYATAVAQNRATLSIAKAQLTKDLASLAYAKANFERNQTMLARQVVSQDVLDNAKSQYDQANAQVGLDQATLELRQADLQAAEINLDYTNIRSPVDGTVVSRNVEMGQTVAASFQTPTLFLIATDLTNMQVDTNVSESDVGALKIGDKSSFTVESFSRRKFDGEVTQIRQAPQTIQNVVTYDAVVAVPNSDLALKPGMTATVRLITDRRDNVQRIPDQALRYVPSNIATPTTTDADVMGGARIYVLHDGQPKLLVVTTGLDDDLFTELIKGDVRPDDQIIVGEQSASVGTNATARPSGLRAPRL